MKKINYNKDTKKIFAIAMPLVFQQLFFQMQIYVDRAMLGHVNSEYFSAVGNATAPYFTVIAIIGAICGATTIFVSQNLGAKKISEARGYAECSFIGNSILPFIFFFLFFFFSDKLFLIMGVQSPILEHSISYLQILSFSLLIFGVETTAQSIIQGIGITKIIMIAGIIKNLLNIIFDYVLIFGKFGFPQLDIKGAAYATLISNLIAAPIIVIYVFKSAKVPFKMDLKNVFKVKWELYKNIIRIGLPAG
ncbi:MAG: MATE family efflux transporter, partial [Lachnospiraceae bacterium]|nr:MATE family efflux transporter [Lachnospiraceae bacterium]